MWGGYNISIVLSALRWVEDVEFAREGYPLQVGTPPCSNIYNTAMTWRHILILRSELGEIDLRETYIF